MTNEEMERAIAFILENQATYEARQAENQAQIAEFRSNIDRFIAAQLELTARIAKATETALQIAGKSLSQGDQQAFRIGNLETAVTEHDQRLNRIEGKGTDIS
jgi:hypothetical protein